MLQTEKNSALSFCKKNKKIILLAIFINLITHVFSQSKDFFVVHGNNVANVSCGEIIFAPLTTAENRKTQGAGSVWIKNTIDLRQPFDIKFVVEFNTWIGIDGGGFVLTADSASVGKSNDGLGFEGINKSVAITLDPIINSEDNDPSFAHVAIQANGDVNHNSINNLAGPVSIESLYITGYNSKMFNHLVNVKWDPATQLLSVYIEKNLYLSAKVDLVEKIFNGNPIVYFGFTGSNTQLQYFPPRTEIEFGHIRFSFGEVVPKYNATPQLDTCFGKPIMFTDNSRYTSENIYDNTDLFKWYWDFGDGTKYNAQNPPPHNYPAPGSYKFQYTVTNQIGCTADTLNKLITLGSTPVVDFSNSPPCNNSPVIFSDKSISPVGDPLMWQWDFGNGTTGNKKDVQALYNSTGLRSVSLKVRTGYGCEAAATKQINIVEKPLIDFDLLKDCEGNVLYTSTLKNAVTVNSWNWNFGDNSSAFDKDVSHFFSTNNSYVTELFAVSNEGCISDTIKQTVVINKIYPFAGNDTVIAISQPLQLNASGGKYFSWLPSTGLNKNLIADPVAILNNDQTYYLTVKNDDGCTAFDTIHIRVYAGPEVYVAKAFTPNNDGLNDILHAVVPGYTIEYFAIYDRNGRLVFQTNDPNKGWDGTYSGSVLPQGNYVWSVKAVDYHGRSIVKKGSTILIH